MSLDFWWGVFAGVSFGVLVLLVVLGIIVWDLRRMARMDDSSNPVWRR